MGFGVLGFGLEANRRGTEVGPDHRYDRPARLSAEVGKDEVEERRVEREEMIRPRCAHLHLGLCFLVKILG